MEAGRGAEVLSDLEQILVGHPSKLILRADPDAGKHLTVTVTGDSHALSVKFKMPLRVYS